MIDVSASNQRAGGAGHRADIDGLRAIAVLAVILFHIDPALVPGGFAGVDIFFVISGYLITGHMAGELSSGRFSLAEFYRRRIKRIAPAMLLVIAVALVAGWALLLPSDLIAMAKSAVWSIASLANVYFWHEANTDYFAPGGELMPLLHLWSLGVEEQFYLLWPLLLMLIWKLAGPTRGGRIAFWLALLLVPLSCVLTAWGYERDGMFVYYMLPTRAGELATGAALALWLVRPQQAAFSAPKQLANVFALLGIALLVGSLALLSEVGPFPGWRALAPTVGAALLLAAGAFVGRHWLAPLLSARPMVWVGAISYSAYLWHWPVLAFWRYLFGQPGLAIQAILLSLILLLSWLSYRWVEQPARASKDSTRGVLLKLYLLPSSLLVACACLPVFGPRLGLDWPSQSFQKRLEAVQEQARPAYRFSWACQHQRLVAGDLTDARCVLGKPADAAARVLLWGDSNAAHYIPMLHALADHAGYRFRNIEIGSCPPLLGDPRPFGTAERYADCAHSLAQVRGALAAYPVIVLAGSWTDYQRRSPEFLVELEATVTRLLADGHQLRLIGKAPVFAGYDPHCAEKAIKLPWLSCSVPSRPLPQDVAAMNAALRGIAARHPGVLYFDANDYLCPEQSCSMKDVNGQTLYFDPGHLSVYGSAKLGGQILAREGVPAALDFSTDH